MLQDADAKIVTNCAAPIVFVWPKAHQFASLLDGAVLPDPDDYPYGIGTKHGRGEGEYAWIAQTYLNLRRAGWPVRISDSFEDWSICVAHYDSVPLRNFPEKSFVVVINPDRPMAYTADLRIFQNRTDARERCGYFMPFWPQPGLLGRDKERGTSVTRAAFLGRYEPSEIGVNALTRDLGALGIKFEVLGFGQWHDLSGVDVALSFRNMPTSYLAHKPASKLINAWSAGVPAVLGVEPAFQELRTSDLDYLEVESHEQIISAAERLKSSPELFHAMVTNGYIRAAEFSRDATVKRWQDLLSGPVATEYKNWRANWRWYRRRAWRVGSTLRHVKARKDWRRRFPPP